MVFISLTEEEVDAKSPVDDELMGKIKDDLDDLDSRLVSAGNAPFVWEFIGPLRSIAHLKRSLGFGIVNKEFTPSVCRFMQKKSGTSGALSFDIRTHNRVNLPLAGIDHQFSANTTSIARASAGATTQSIARATSQVLTQSVSFAKASSNVQSIIAVPGTNRWRYNLDAAPDADYVLGATITFASCTNAANNGSFVIVEKNQSGGNNLVIVNASGVAQNSAAGTAQLRLMSYNYTNPMNANFVAGESAIFASHTDPANDGTKAIYKVNEAGNNLWVFNATGVAQAGVAGNVNVARWIYTYSVAVSTTYFVVGQKAHFTSHTSSNNDGDLVIVAVNSGGNNLVIYNTLGVTQGGAAGTGAPNHWTYSLDADPSAQVSIADTVRMATHTTAANNGTFTVSEVTSSTIAVYNVAGVAQVGAAGTVATTRKLIKFFSDQSALFTTDSYVELFGCPSGLYNAVPSRSPFKVLQINRGGGANYNVVIDNPTAPAQAAPAGILGVEMKSIFNTPPSLAASTTGNTGDELVKGVSLDLIGDAIAAETPVMLYITSIMSGTPEDLTISIA